MNPPEEPGPSAPIEPIERAAMSLRHRHSRSGSGHHNRSRSRRHQPKKPRWKRPSTWIVGVLVVVLVVPLLYVAYVFSIVDGIRRAPLLPTFDGPQGQGTNILVLASQKDDSLLRVDPDSLFIQLIHLGADRSGAAIIHFPRQLVIKEGAVRETLAKAHADDGAAGIAHLLQQRLHLRIDHIAQVDLQAYVRATDRLGGVDLTDDQDGPLTGAKALEWTSTGETEVVLGRRQQDWERSLLRDILRPGVVLNPFTLVGLLKDFADNAVLDETFANRAVRSLAWQSRNLTPSQIIFFTAPLRNLDKARTAAPDAEIRADEAGLTRLGEVLAVDNSSGIAAFDN